MFLLLAALSWQRGGWEVGEWSSALGEKVENIDGLITNETPVLGRTLVRNMCTHFPCQRHLLGFCSCHLVLSLPGCSVGCGFEIFHGFL